MTDSHVLRARDSYNEGFRYLEVQENVTRPEGLLDDIEDEGYELVSATYERFFQGSSLNGVYLFKRNPENKRSPGV